MTKCIYFPAIPHRYKYFCMLEVRSCLQLVIIMLMNMMPDGGSVMMNTQVSPLRTELQFLSRIIMSPEPIMRHLSFFPEFVALILIQVYSTVLKLAKITGTVT
jgi:hypothetical protein